MISCELISQVTGLLPDNSYIYCKEDGKVYFEVDGSVKSMITDNSSITVEMEPVINDAVILKDQTFSSSKIVSIIESAANSVLSEIPIHKEYVFENKKIAEVIPGKYIVLCQAAFQADFSRINIYATDNENYKNQNLLSNIPGTWINQSEGKTFFGIDIIQVRESKPLIYIECKDATPTNFRVVLIRN